MVGVWGGVGLREVRAAIIKRILENTCLAQVSISPEIRTDQEGAEKQDE